MQMLRHYFISDNLDDLEVFEEQLEGSGISTPQIHVLSKHDEEIAHHDHLNYVQSFMQKDVVHCTECAAVIGLAVSSLLLLVAYVAGWTDTPAGWMPFIFLAIILLGFIAWEGGLLGIQKPNYHFSRFSDALNNDKHIFFVDAQPDQEEILAKFAAAHPHIELAGTGEATPYWILALQDKVPRFFKTTFP